MNRWGVRLLAFLLLCGLGWLLMQRLAPIGFKLILPEWFAGRG